MAESKLKQEQQKKLKQASNIVRVIAKVGKVTLRVVAVIMLIFAVIVPFVVSKVSIIGDEIKYGDTKVGIIEDTNDLLVVKNFLNNHSNTVIIVYTEVLIICVVVTLIASSIVLYYLEQIFKNIHDEDTPFTLENVAYIRKLAQFLAVSIVVPACCSILFSSSFDIDFGGGIKITDVILILVLECMASVFEYGHAIQRKSNTKIYDKKKK